MRRARAFGRGRPVPPRRGAAAGVVAIVIALGVLVALLAWFVAGGGDAHTSTALDPTQPADVRVDPASSRTLDEARRADEARAPAAEVAAAPIESAASEAPDTIARTPVEVLVVDAASGAPVAGADVRWANLSEYGIGDPGRKRDVRDDVEALLASARRATTDANGVARIDSRVLPTGLVHARHGIASGWTHASTHAPLPLRVEIAPDRGLVIEVVDEAGRPIAGAPVALRSMPRQIAQAPHWRGTTDEHGRATLRALGPKARSGRAFACLEILADAVPQLPIDLADPPRDPIRLVMPPCGSVTVVARDSEGSPIRPESIALAVEFRDKKGATVWNVAEFHPETLDGSRAEFPFVGVGTAIQAQVVHTYAMMAFEARAPSFGGEHVVVTVDVGAPVVELTARLVDESGRPLALRWLTQSAASSASPIGGQNPLRTDADGRLRRDLRVQVGTPISASFCWQLIGIGQGEGTRVGAHVEMPAAPRVIDLGDLVCREPFAISAGVVVDDRGRAVAAPTIGFETADGAARAPGAAWREFLDGRVVADADGRFTITATARPDRLRLFVVGADGMHEPPVEVDVGALDVVLRVGRASTIGGTLLLDAGVDAALIDVRVVYTDAIERERRYALTRLKVAPDGSFASGPMPHGRANVHVRAPGRKEPVHVVTDVELPPGERAVDARLDAIDLRGVFDVNAPSGKGAK